MKIEQKMNFLVLPKVHLFRERCNRMFSGKNDPGEEIQKLAFFFF
jgi:hypothetical protein